MAKPSLGLVSNKDKLASRTALTCRRLHCGDKEKLDLSEQ